MMAENGGLPNSGAVLVQEFFSQNALAHAFRVPLKVKSA
jgi:hypothetical protein